MYKKDFLEKPLVTMGGWGGGGGWDVGFLFLKFGQRGDYENIAQK